MWKWIVGIFVILALLCGGGGFFLTGTERGKGLVRQLRPKEKQTEVRIEPVKRGDLVKLVSAPGAVEPRTKVLVSAQVSAKIIALPIREGSAVRKGDVVCRLDADDLLAALESAKASMKGEQARLDGLKAELANAAAEWGRIRELYDTKDVSKSAMDQAEANWLRAQASVRSSEHSIEIAQANIVRAQKNLDFTTIVSSIDGVIIKLNNEVGEQVLGTFNNAGTVIMEIADLSTMLLKARIDESSIAPVKAGQRATIHINAYRDRTFPGVVELVGLKRQLDRDGTGYFEAQILVEQSEDIRLPSGATGNAEIAVQTFADVLKVPSQAVVDRRVDELSRELVNSSPNVDKNKIFARVVYKVVDGKTVAVPVSIGASDVTHTVIVSGLDEKDPVVTGPYKVLVSLKNDQKVVDESVAQKEREAKDKNAKPVADKTGGGGTT